MNKNIFMVVALVAVLITQVASVAVSEEGTLAFSDIASMPAALFWQTATPLKDGRILIAGGSDASGQQAANAYLYNPDTDQYVPTGSMNQPRHAHSATLLNDGRVLVVGGYHYGWLSDAEVYNPASGTWSVVPSPKYNHGVSHTATALEDGRVFVIGGAIGGYSAKVEIFNPSDNTWTERRSLPEPRGAHTATLLDNGKILVAGGDTSYGTRCRDSRIYDPVTDSFSAPSLMTIGEGGRSYFEAIKLNDGRVLAVGGLTKADSEVLSSSEIYDPNTGFWTATAPMSFARYEHKLVLLPDGTVLAVGGANLYESHWTPDSFIKPTEIFDPQTLVWNEGPIMKDARVCYALASLDTSHWFLFGGRNNSPSMVLNTACTLTWTSSQSTEWLTCIGFSNQLDGQQNMVEFNKLDTLYITFKDVNFDSRNRGTFAYAFVSQRQKRNYVRLSKQTDGSFTASVPLSSYRIGNVNVLIGASYHGQSLVRNSQITIRNAD